jgi:hypothetical protein
LLACLRCLLLLQLALEHELMPVSGHPSPIRLRNRRRRSHRIGQPSSFHERA